MVLRVRALVAVLCLAVALLAQRVSAGSASDVQDNLQVIDIVEENQVQDVCQDTLCLINCQNAGWTSGGCMHRPRQDKTCQCRNYAG